jgi:hypothetical protein
MKTIRAVALSLLAVCFLAMAPIDRSERGTDVHIVFSGLICHLFDGAHAPRAVAMRGHAGMEHQATLHIAAASIASSDVTLACAGGECTLDLANAALRFAPGSGRAHYDAGGSFDTIVPKLRAVTNGQMSVREDAFDEVPSPHGPVLASIELPSGAMTAIAYSQTARYEPDFEGRGQRQFAREVALDGHVSMPHVLVRRAGDGAWQRITFKRDALIELRITNEPAASATSTMPHSSLFYDLSAVPLTVEPRIVRPNRGIESDNLSIECSNTGCC